MDQLTTSSAPTASPAPHRPLDPSRPALVPRLIDDVLLLILDELAQPDYTDEGYKSRQHTLRSVCLASRRLCALAQPLLWRQVVVSEDKQLEQLRESGAVLGAGTKVYTIGSGGACDMQTALGTGAAGLRHVEHMLLWGARDVDLSLSWLQGYSSLRHLELHNVDSIRVDLNPPPALPLLEELLLVGCGIAPGHATGWLSSTWLPRLKVLIVLPTRSTLRTSLAPCLADQLDVVQVSTAANMATIGPCASRMSRAVVVLNPVLLGPLEFNSMFTQSPYFLGDCRRVLSRLTKLIADEPQADAAAPPVLMLSIQARNANTVKWEAALRAKPGVGTWQGLEDVCRQRGRRVIWYDEHEPEASREFVPREFRRHVRELKARNLVESASASASSSSR